ncbi:MAG: hypothetical protein Kow0029_26930 [Candidatus Rifleibacteriota bacterium]
MAAIIFSGVIAYRNIMGLEVFLEVPEVVYAGEEASIKCVVRETGGRNHYAIAFENDLIKQILPNDEVRLNSRFVADARGVYQTAEFSIFSYFPIGLNAVSILIPSQKIFIGPRCARLLPDVIDREIGGAIQKYQAGKEGEYWMQKIYQYGEDASLINWNISARSDVEWVLVKAQNFGFPEKLFFDFSGIQGQLFEDCLEIVAGIFYKLRNAGSSAFVWAQQENGAYSWLSISENYPTLCHWLARLRADDQIPPPMGEYRAFDFSEFMGQF